MTHHLETLETSDGRYEVQRFGCTVQVRAWMVQPQRPQGGYWDELFCETAADESEAAEWFRREIETLERT